MHIQGAWQFQLQPTGPHPIQGIGPNLIPNILDRTVYDEILDATAEDAIKFARRAGAEEGILAGISSGVALVLHHSKLAMQLVQHQIP